MSVDRQLLKGTVITLILRLLSENDMYGYQMIKELEARSERMFSLNEGALYPVLHRLEKEGHIEAYWEESGGRNRKYYHLTKKGHALFSEKEQEWRTFSRSFDIVLGGA
ncbi:PadR family transcriptional regulator [Oscillospiraceae bacterium OttesenSCG-928-F05]|nr:PadR family transcriptional regulator [Oscillospiraceae bacterium OttesenSCG-928-F05]